MSKLFIVILLIAATANLPCAQTTAFNFQGRLNDGAGAASGAYDFQFKLFDAIAGGSQVGGIALRPNLRLADGVFSTTLDFGAGAFGSGNRFLEIAVRPAGSPNEFVVLGARQQVLSVPLAIRASKATNADIAEIASVATNALQLGGILPTGYVRLNETNTGNLVINGNTQQNGSVSVNELTVAQNASVTGNSSVGGNVSIGGNAVQPAASLGMAKALIYVSGFSANGAFINRCYNGVTGSSAGNCGFTLTEPLGRVGVYRINMGFPVNSRFVVATSEYGGTIAGQNTVPQYRFFDATTIEIFLTRITSPADTTTFDFMLMVF